MGIYRAAACCAAGRFLLADELLGILTGVYVDWKRLFYCISV